MSISKHSETYPCYEKLVHREKLLKTGKLAVDEVSIGRVNRDASSALSVMME